MDHNDDFDYYDTVELKQLKDEIFALYQSWRLDKPETFEKTLKEFFEDHISIL